MTEILLFNFDNEVKEIYDEMNMKRPNCELFK